ncbi:MAG: hypothetical protein IKG23_11075 [Clostridia bacterium]|nr:hypothetical protein [Clostridia bacterium]
MEENRINWRVLGNRIADMRMSRGISQIRLAELTGLSRGISATWNRESAAGLS